MNIEEDNNLNQNDKSGLSSEEEQLISGNLETPNIKESQPTEEIKIKLPKPDESDKKEVKNITIQPPDLSLKPAVENQKAKEEIPKKDSIKIDAVSSVTPKGNFQNNLSLKPAGESQKIQEEIAKKDPVKTYAVSSVTPKSSSDKVFYITMSVAIFFYLMSGWILLAYFSILPLPEVIRSFVVSFGKILS
ncbi:hypothetical protein IIB34_03070 [PVC group bacterium]|nr:hypothetical protein [PVC group bacterium]